MTDPPFKINVIIHKALHYVVLTKSDEIWIGSLKAQQIYQMLAY
jgi:hypothetical protein